MNSENLLFAFGLTLLAGISTGIGSLLSLFTKRTDMRVLSVALGFSAGVMIYVSFVEIFVEAKTTLIAALGNRNGTLLTVAGFFAGMLLIAIIDKLLPESENPHEIHTAEEMDGKSEMHRAKLMRVGLLTALAITIHNFPEGISTFTAALRDPQIGIPIAFAIAIHNIPEGISVAVPIFYATGSRRKAFTYSFLSGFSEPLGALVAYFFILKYMNDVVFGFIFAAVAGIMVFISMDELLPSARECGEHHLSIIGMVAGMCFMAVSLLLFAG